MIRKLARFLKQGCSIWFKEGATPWAQLRDMYFFHRVTRMRPGEFYRYRLWDRLRPIEDRLAFLSFEEHRMIESALNPAASVRALNDKLTAAERLVLAGVSMPATLGSVETETQAGTKKSPVDIANELKTMLAGSRPHGVVMKPNRGAGGRDILFFLHAGPDGLTRLDGSHVTIEAVAAELARGSIGRWKVEERLMSHPALAQVAPNSLCTMRVLSLRYPNGKIHVGPASIKFPVDGSAVDNFHSGNLAAPVELNTGRVGTAVRLAGGARLAIHPTSGQRLEGLIVPDLSEVVSLVTAAATEMSDLTVLGWDVALTPVGPMILEGNAWWAEDLLQQPQSDGLLRGEFGTLIEVYGLTELLVRREQGAAGWGRQQAAARWSGGTQ